MAHYAFIDENNIVTEVIVGKDEDDLDQGVQDWEEWYGNFRGQKCLRTSYNTKANAHLYGGQPFRYNFAEVGGEYREDKDGFVPLRPYGLNSWVVDENTLTWVPPVPYPSDGREYFWSEESASWVLAPESAANTYTIYPVE